MKKLTLILSIVLLAGCTKSIDIDGKKILIKPGSKYRQDDNQYYFYPNKNAVYSIFGLNAKLDSEFEHSINNAGIITKGKLAEEFIGKNSKAEFTVPSGTEFEYREKHKDYDFLINDNTGKIKNEIIEYDISEYLVINDKLNFAAKVKERVEFYKDGEIIIFLKNDITPWNDNKDFDYYYFSKEYRDKLEYDILTNINTVSINKFQTWLEPKGGPGMHNFAGQSYELVIDTKKVDLKVNKLVDDSLVKKCFRYIRVGRPDISSYGDILEIPLDISQFDKKRVGLLELIIPLNEVDNIEEIIRNKEKLHLVFRMGLFNDFDVKGFGIVYFSYNIQQRSELLNRYKDS